MRCWSSRRQTRSRMRRPGRARATTSPTGPPARCRWRGRCHGPTCRARDARCKRLARRPTGRALLITKRAGDGALRSRPWRVAGHTIAGSDGKHDVGVAARCPASACACARYSGAYARVRTRTACKLHGLRLAHTLTQTLWLLSTRDMGTVNSHSAARFRVRVHATCVCGMHALRERTSGRRSRSRWPARWGRGSWRPARQWTPGRSRAACRRRTAPRRTPLPAPLRAGAARLRRGPALPLGRRTFAGLAAGLSSLVPCLGQTMEPAQSEEQPCLPQCMQC